MSQDATVIPIHAAEEGADADTGAAEQPAKRFLDKADLMELAQFEAQIQGCHLGLGQIEADLLGLEERKEAARQKLIATARERQNARLRIAKRYGLVNRRGVAPTNWQEIEEAFNRVNPMTGEITDSVSAS